MGWTRRVASSAGGAARVVRRWGTLARRNSAGLIDLISAAALRGVNRTTSQPDDPATAAYREASALAAREIGRINVLVAGNTGVGKSTLVNAIFGDNVAPTASGLPVTQALSVYEAPGKPLNLWDTRGFEAGDDAAVKAVDAKLAELRGASHAEAQIHVAWLCISSEAKRVEPVHLSFLRHMAERNIPTIVVWTQTYESLDYEVRALAQPAAASVEVLASDRAAFGKRAFNLDALVDATDRVLPEARKAAFAAAQSVQRALKKTEAHRVVMLAAASVAATAVLPGQSLVLGAAQTAMLAKIDAIFGRPMLSSNATALKGVVSLAGEQGSRWLFGTLLTDGLKLTGGGYAIGVAIGAVAGAAFTSTVGYAYVEALDRFGDVEFDVPVAEIADFVLKALRQAMP